MFPVREVCSLSEGCVLCYRNVFHTIDTLSEECVPYSKHSVSEISTLGSSVGVLYRHEPL